MDVKLLLNDDNSAERPRICRFGRFEPQRAANRSAKEHPLQPQHQQRPHLPPPAQSRTPSYSSDSSSSTSSTSGYYHHRYSPPSASASSHPHTYSSRHPLTESPPSISTGVPPLARSDSGDSDRPHSPLTPDTSPGSTPCLTVEQSAQRIPSKAFSFITRSLPRPHILSHASSYSAASSSGPPSSMDPFAANSANGFMGDMSFPPTPAQAQPYFNPQMPLAGSPEQQQSSFATSSPPAQKPGQKKNSYPCPLARQFNCSEYFTTSGHAARHAKKHTGKKDAICPECNKAFTRKDNMEQHRRTHSKDSSAASRSSLKSQAEKDDSRQRKMLKLQHQQQQQQQQQSKKIRPPTLSTATSTTSSTGNLNSNQLASPSISSAVTSPGVDLLPTPNSMSNSVATPLSLDMTLDPRLRDGSASAGPTSAFSPSSFTPTSFPVSSPPLFSPPFSSGQQQQQFQLQHQHQHQQQIPLHHHQHHQHHQHHRHSSMNMVSAQPMSSPMASMSAQLPQRHSFGNSMEFMASQQPLGLGMTLPTAPGLELGMPGTMAMMMDDSSMSMNTNSSMIGAPGDLQSPGLVMAPAMDKLALDKLALAAEAASQGRQ